MGTQLTVKRILEVISMLQKQGMSLLEIYKLPVYIGDDEELNGIHSAWYINSIDANNKEDINNMEFVNLINQDSYHNVVLKGKAIVIS